MRLWRGGLAAATAVALSLPLMGGAPAGAVPQTQYLLSVTGSDLPSVAAAVSSTGGRVLHVFDIASALLVTMPQGVLPPQGAVAVPDMVMEFQGAPAATDRPANTYRDTIDAPAAPDGAGVTVALVDTGVADTGEVDVTHVNVSGGPAGDGYGHGTFLAGLVAGDGASSGGAYAGVAPGAEVLDVQVALPDGSTSLSKVLAGLQAVADHRAADPSLKVMSLALSTDSPLPPWIDPLSRGLESLWAQGVTVVVASGNDGAGAVSAPASDPTLLAVGAVQENQTPARSDDTLADFSAYATTFGAERPDLAAPGVSLVSLKAPGSVADVENPGSAVGDKYFKGTGTSMSAAVTAGAAALLTSQRASLTPNDVKRLLVGTAYTAPGLTTGSGAGGLDLGQALTTDVADVPRLKFDPVATQFGPDEADAATWAAFSQAWADGDLKAVVAAWIELSPQTRKWAATAWALQVLTRSLTMPEGDFLGRRWSGRRWSTQPWEGRRWSEDEWVGRRWSTIDWSGRRWSQDTWLTADWAGRRWSSEDWLAFAWTVRVSPVDPMIENLWTAEDLDGRRWSGRRWSVADWAGRRWSFEAWEGRRWSDYAWDGRRWSDYGWDGRRWSGEEWNGRRWSGELWDGRRWSDFAFAGRRWATEQWAGRRWSVTGWGS